MRVSTLIYISMGIMHIHITRPKKVVRTSLSVNKKKVTSVLLAERFGFNSSPYSKTQVRSPQLCKSTEVLVLYPSSHYEKIT